MTDKETMAIIKQMVADGHLSQEVAEKYLPELKEPEDERIRKAIINVFASHKDYEIFFGASVKDILAWLERQKTSEESMKYLEENHSPSEMSDFQAAMNIAVAKAFDAGKKHGEQKPIKWSEEDEDKMILIEDRFSDYLDYVREDNSLTKYQKNSTKDEIVNLSNWLKSLKDRYTWKPSDEQIKACKEVYADVLSAKGFDVGAINSELNRLEEQLKNL